MNIWKNFGVVTVGFIVGIASATNDKGTEKTSEQIATAADTFGLLNNSEITSIVSTNKGAAYSKINGYVALIDEDYNMVFFLVPWLPAKEPRKPIYRKYWQTVALTYGTEYDGFVMSSVEHIKDYGRNAVFRLRSKDGKLLNFHVQIESSGILNIRIASVVKD